MALYTKTQKPAKKGFMNISFLWTLILFCGLIVFGVMFSVSMMPNHIESGPTTNSILAKGSGSISLKQKLLEWMPQQNRELINALPGTPLSIKKGDQPDWDQEMWTPIDVDNGSTDPYVTLCKLNFKEYSSHPHMFAMFRDFVTMSQCTGRNKKRQLLSELLREIKENEGNPSGRVVKPTGFVFHESRVGSTLFANMLGSDPWSMVYSESAPAANAILHCGRCSREQNIQLIRDVFTVMGRSPFHERLFFKFQSITSTKMDLVLEAFPDTPWAYVYRQPVQTMMSHLDPRKGSSGAPCLRSMRDSPEEITSVIKKVGGSSSSKEAWCAGHLNMLCSHAIDSYNRFSSYNANSELNGKQRGFLVNYESLPGIIPSVLLPMFGVTAEEKWLEKMADESSNYSKGRKGSKKFEGDSEDKDARATDAIQKYASKILSPTYDEMLKFSEAALKNVAPEWFDSLVGSDNRIEWSKLKSIPLKLSSQSQAIITKFARAVPVPPATTVENTAQSSHRAATVDMPLDPNKMKLLHANTPTATEQLPHSVLHGIDYVPWAPFANTHNSKPYERVECPLHPPPGYPKTYLLPDLLNNWNTDSTEIPPFHYDSLCHFNFQNSSELAAAYNYREQDLPFVVYNIPEVDTVAKNWGDIDYLQKKLGKKKYRTETSNDNHFMYWRGGASPFLRGKDGNKWKPPTSVISQTFQDWLELAVKGQNKSLENREHQYFRVSSDIGNDWLFNELPFFQPKKNLMLVEPREQRGIHCRFGMRSVIAEAHFDGSRNAVVMLGGLRRWILAHPNQCTEMYMYQNGHPSGRHSEVDWSKPDYNKFPRFAKIQANEVILQPGDMLYVPTFWIHYITSLNINYQCNSRSGKTNKYNHDLNLCGF